MHAAHTPRYGSSRVLEVRETPPPSVGPTDVLVQVFASPVTAGDRRLRAADFPTITALPGRLMIGLFRPRASIQGTMFAGRVVQVGAEVTTFAVGDDVFGAVDHGAWGERVTVSADGPVARIPAGVSYDEAAAVPYAGVTALRLLRDVANVQPGQRVLIVGAAGGVGRYAVQVARHLGAEVTGVCSADDAAFVRDLGAVDTIDYRAHDFATLGRTWDVVFDIADVSSFGHARPALAPDGMYVTLSIGLGVLGGMLTNRFRRQQVGFAIALGTADDLETLRGWLEAGVFRPTVAETYPLARIADAHDAAARRPLGEVIVRVTGDTPRLRAVG